MENHDDPEHWRDRSADVRARAAETNNEGSRYVLLFTADSYDMLAELAERRLLRLQSQIGLVQQSD
jgi:hypothetical protein